MAHTSWTSFARCPDSAQRIPEQGDSCLDTKFAKELLHKLPLACSSIQCDQLRFARALSNNRL
eukprot:11221550-Heterocapsa_arctica.AAC.1